MSSISLSSSALSPAARGPVRPVGRERSARNGLGTVVVAVFAIGLVDLIGSALIGDHLQFLPLATVSGSVMFTLIPAGVTALLYAALLRAADRSARAFAPIAAAAFVVTLLPDVTANPAAHGATGGPAAVLVLLHVVAAGVIVGLLTALARPPAR